MKKVFLFAALSIGLYSCKDAANKTVTTSDSTKTETTTKAEPTLTGKWMVIDLQSKDDSKSTVKPEEIKARVMKDSMVFEFTADGNAISSSKSLPTATSKFVRNGNMLEITSDKGKKDGFEIMSLTERNLTMKMKGENPGEEMTFLFERF